MDAHHDIFVSYAHSDNEPLFGRDRGWVTTLVDELRKTLRQKLGRKPDIWTDASLAANETPASSLVSKVINSRVMLLVLSNGYLASKWCHQELGQFMLTHFGRGDRPPVFVVSIDDIDRKDWPLALDGSIPIKFWHRPGGEGTPVHMLGFPDPIDDQHRGNYWQRLGDLTAHISAVLAPRKDSEKPRKAVFLAECTDDLTYERESVGRFLTQQGFDVLPYCSYARSKGFSYVRHVQDDVKKAHLFVQLLSKDPGFSSDSVGGSIVAVQAQAGIAARRERGIPVLQWRARDLNVYDPSLSQGHAELLRGADVIACGLEELKREIIRMLEDQNRGVEPGLRAVSEDLAVFVAADEADSDMAQSVSEKLKGLGTRPIRCKPFLSGQTPEQNRRQLEEQLNECMAALVVWGRSPPTWVTAQLLQVRKQLATRRRAPWAGLLAGPPPEKKIKGEMLGLVLVDWREGEKQEMLKAFVDKLRPGAAASV